MPAIFQVYTRSMGYLTRDWQVPAVAAIPISGGIAGVALSFFLSPAELIKVSAGSLVLCDTNPAPLDHVLMGRLLQMRQADDM